MTDRNAGLLGVSPKYLKDRVPVRLYRPRDMIVCMNPKVASSRYIYSVHGPIADRNI